jgi:hypothetical protein
MNKKCSVVGCYEAADCVHGKCHKHCHHKHDVKVYHDHAKPRSRAPHIGVEVEVEFHNETDRKRAVAYSSGGTTRGIATPDGSLSDCSAEFKLLCLQERAVTGMKKLVTELYNRRAHVSARCGLHVHLDMRGVPNSKIDDALVWMQATQEVWFSMIPPRRRHSGWCRRIDSHNQRDHYTWAHATPYSTLEVRIHPGTLNPFKMEGWVTALMYLADRIRSDEPFPLVGENVGDARKCFENFWDVCPSAGREYILTRLSKQGVLQDYSFQPREEEELNNV